jgi:membrane associated rhomboid family serine protease
MGAFLVLYPRARILTLVFIIIFITTIDIPAALLLLYWFAIQLFSGIFSLGSIADAQSVAWFAHVGGFLAGVLLLRTFVRKRPRYGY